MGVRGDENWHVGSAWSALNIVGSIVTLKRCNLIRVAYTCVSYCPRGQHVDCKNISAINHERSGETTVLGIEELDIKNKA